MKTTVTLLCFFLVLFTTKAQRIIKWDFEDDGAPTLFPSYIGDTAVSVNPVAFSGVFPNDPSFMGGASGLSGDFASVFRGWPTLVEWDASDYLQFRFSIDSGAVLKVTSLSLWFKRSLSGPRTLHFRSDYDGYAEPIDSVVVSESDNLWHEWSFPLDSFVTNGYQQVTFRLYGNDAISNSLGTLAVDSVVIYGEVLRSVEIPLRVVLSGPWNGFDMSDSLRRKGFVPTTDPYNFGENTTTQVLQVSGSQAVVDWVVVQLRDSIDPGLVSAESAFLLQRDGDVVDVGGVSPPRLYASAGQQYYVSVLHRNHLGAITASTVALEDTIDFVSGGTAVLGIEPLQSLGSSWGLWSGDVNGDNLIKYTGTQNDRDAVLVTVGSFSPNNVESGYFDSDVNMDGLVKYTGSLNDRDPILLSIGSLIPTNVRVAQLP